jgi:hypothetical protein
MHKSVITLSSLFSLVSLVMLLPFANISLFSNTVAMAQGNEYDGKSYNNNKNYDDMKVSLYPTKVNKYECQKGPFEGFFVSSVEFCKDVPIVNLNGIDPQLPPSPSDPQIIQVFSGTQETTVPSSTDQVNEPNLYFRDGNPATTNKTSQIMSVAFCDPSDKVIQGFYQLTNKQENPILGFINQITGEKNAYSTALISSNVTLQSTAFCFNNNS